jgi:hypothetical protein
VEGSYGTKYTGGIGKRSLITKENGFETIHYSGIGVRLLV